MLKDMDKKKLMFIGIAIVGIIVLIIIILLVYHAFNNKVSYTDIENKLLDASKSYYKEHSELLPQTSKDTVYVDDITLTSSGYLDSMSDLTSKLDVTCNGKVYVNYSNNDYRYVPVLDCGESYKTKLFNEYIKNNTEIVYSGNGLYELNGELVFRGDKPNNYINFDGNDYRIVKIDNNGDIVLILDERFQRSVWDDRFNIEKNSEDGINDYTMSRIKDNLEKLYNDGDVVSDNNKKLLKSFTLEIGKRAEMDETNDGSLEKSAIVENSFVGLLPLYDYLNASIDINCLSPLNESCKNYNYLDIYDYNWWTITALQETTRRVFNISSDGSIRTSKCSTNGYIRPVIHLANNVIYVSGDGTKDNPYKIK